MVILQRWEPIISSSFPSKIPFWIDIQGLPKHYWKPKMINNIAEEIGELMDHEITSSHAKIKVLLAGLRPLLKETIVEFPEGGEVLVTLDYKNLKNHCLHCLRLTHEKKDCPGLQISKSLHQRSPSQSSKNLATQAYNEKKQHAPNASHSAHDFYPRHQSFNSHQDRHPPSKRQHTESGYKSKHYSDARSHELRTSRHRRSITW